MAERRDRTEPPPAREGAVRAVLVQVFAIALALLGRVSRPSWLRAPSRSATTRADGRLARLVARWPARLRPARPVWLATPDRWRLPVGTARRRSALLMAAYLVVLTVLAGRLVQVQAVNAQTYAERGDSQSMRAIDLPAQRGRIIDRNGAVLTTTVDAAAIYTDPTTYDGFADDGKIDRDAGEVSRRDVAIALAPVLGRSVDDLVDVLSSEGRFTYLARQLKWDVGEEVMALDLPGIHRVVEPSRRYPGGTLASSLIGITDIDGVGLEGLEALANDELTGEPGQLRVERAASGNMDIASADRELEPSVPGTDMVLTIDRDLQAQAEAAATDAMVDNRADGASVLVMDATTGEILAAASVPGVDPSNRNGTDRDDRRARYFTDAFEPGSVQKAVTIAAAWEEGLIDGDTVMEVPPTWTVGGRTWTEPFGATGELHVSEVIERSSNIGTMMIADELGEEKLDEWLRRFGYGQPTGVGFPGESAGLLLPHEQWSGTSLPTIAIGHGVAVSLVQLASFYQTLANDGVAIQPSILRGTVGQDGRLEPAATPDSRSVVSADTARSVRTLMQGVVDGEHGTGKNAAVVGYDVAGKTGTADKPRADGRGYTNQTTAVFVGMAPVDEPELVVAVMVDEPETIYGGTAAAPTFSRVMGQALADRDVVPGTPQQGIDDALAGAREREAASVAASRSRAARAAEAARERTAERRARRSADDATKPADRDATATDGGESDEST